MTVRHISKKSLLTYKKFIVVSIKTSVVPRSIPSSHAILKNFKMNLGLGMKLAYNIITMTAMINELQVC